MKIVLKLIWALLRSIICSNNGCVKYSITAEKSIAPCLLEQKYWILNFILRHPISLFLLKDT